MVANKNSNVSSGQRHPLSKWGNDDVDLVSNINWLGREGTQPEIRLRAPPENLAETQANTGAV